ncbi:MAG TPA: hypothetical protein VLV31_13265 [Candidatus Acidoferrales bacterium]|nr:hypothetical protein [Candidatus Acidoferrales bacterium]
MKTKFKLTWIRMQVQGANGSINLYTRVPGIKEVGRSKIEKATGSFKTLICLLTLTRMICNPLGFSLGRRWVSHAAAHDFQTRQAARRVITESQGKMPIAR